MAERPERRKMKVIIYLVFIVMVIAPILVGIISNLWFGLATGVGLWGGFIIQGFRKITADPPHKALITIFGKRTNKVKNEGWRFFPLFPYWYGYIKIKVEEISFSVVLEARTPDRVVSKVPTLVTIKPCPEYFIEYLNSGGENGVKTQITGKIKERIREWAIADEEGPTDWEELNKSQLEATSVLTARIAQKFVSEIPPFAQEIPTFIWLRYYSKPQPKKFFKNEEWWAKENWAKVKEVLKRIEEEQGPGVEDILKRAVEARREDIKSLRNGTGNISIKDLGVILKRLNIDEIEVLGGVAKQAEKEAQEIQEREGERLELEHVKTRIKELMGEPLNYSKEQALEIVQTERDKVKKNIQEQKISIGPETRDFIEKIAKIVIKKGGMS